MLPRIRTALTAKGWIARLQSKSPHQQTEPWHYRRRCRWCARRQGWPRWCLCCAAETDLRGPDCSGDFTVAVYWQGDWWPCCASSTNAGYGKDSRDPTIADWWENRWGGDFELFNSSRVCCRLVRSSLRMTWQVESQRVVNIFNWVHSFGTQQMNTETLMNTACTARILSTNVETMRTSRWQLMNGQMMTLRRKGKKESKGKAAAKQYTRDTETECKQRQNKDWCA